jgi:hypothetical protein
VSQDTTSHFGLTIAYVVPGFITLVALSHFSPSVRAWLLPQSGSSPTVGGFLYSTLASFTSGLTLSTVRWFVLDRVHHRTGLPRPKWDFSRLQDNIDAFELAIEYHYRYYQFYGNTLVALLFVIAFPQALAGFIPGNVWIHRLLLSALAGLFFLASRDALWKYYGRSSALHDGSLLHKDPNDDQRLETSENADPPAI